MKRSRYILLLGAMITAAGVAVQFPEGEENLLNHFRDWEAATHRDALNWYRSSMAPMPALEKETGDWETRERRFVRQIIDPCMTARAQSWLGKEVQKRQNFLLQHRYQINTEFNRRGHAVETVKAGYLGTPSYIPNNDVAAEEQKQANFNAWLGSDIVTEVERQNSEGPSLGALVAPLEDSRLFAPTSEGRMWNLQVHFDDGMASPGGTELELLKSDTTALQNGNAPDRYRLGALSDLVWKGRAVTITFRTDASTPAEVLVDRRMLPEILPRWKRHYVRLLGRERLEKKLLREELPQYLKSANCADDGRTEWSKGVSR